MAFILKNSFFSSIFFFSYKRYTSGTALAEQMQGPEFQPQYCKKEIHFLYSPSNPAPRQGYHWLFE
jgi:hypothetical protein